MRRIYNFGKVSSRSRILSKGLLRVYRYLRFGNGGEQEPFELINLCGIISLVSRNYENQLLTIFYNISLRVLSRDMDR